jgi:DHA1 family bicyclomycin/chloramphenicol resistance-like MFS transporter
MESKQPVNTRLVVALLGSLTALGPLSIDMYLPAFPNIAGDLKTDISHITISLSVYFFGVSAGQLIYGPLLERFGRKKPLFVGLFIYIIAAGVCALAPSVELLITGRLFQAIGGCVGMVATRAIVRDLYPVDKTVRIFSLLMLVTSVSPMVAPTAGGFIASTLGWRYIFVILIVMAILVLAGIYFLLPESHPPDKRVSMTPHSIIRNYRIVLRNRQFLFYTMAGAVCSIGMFGYVAAAPTIFLSHFHMSQKEFGWMIGTISIVVVIASQLNNLVLLKLKMNQVALLAAALQILISIIFICFGLFGFNSALITFGFIAVILACLGFIFPNSGSLAMAPMDKDAGDASALSSALQMFIGAAASAVVGSLPEKTIVTVAIVMACSAASAFILLLF